MTHLSPTKSQDGDLQRLLAGAAKVGVKEAWRWYRYDARPGQRIWVCIDPWDQFDINQSETPPRRDDDGRWVA